jgi:predicted nucleic-acid-binding protein
MKGDHDCVKALKDKVEKLQIQINEQKGPVSKIEMKNTDYKQQFINSVNELLQFNQTNSSVDLAQFVIKTLEYYDQNRPAFNRYLDLIIHSQNINKLYNITSDGKLVEKKVKNPSIIALVNKDSNFGLLYYPQENKLYLG